MAKRFTDTEKWKDEWYTELSNDYKVIWQYILDNCDIAGIFKRNMKAINYYCNTNVSADEVLEVFKKRITVLSDDKWIVNKFCVYQYGHDFLHSTNKAVIAAHKILEDNNVIQFTGKLIDYEYGKNKEIKQRKEYRVLIDYNYPMDRVSIPYKYPIDTPKDKVKDKVQDKVKDKDNVKDIVQEQGQEQELSYGIAYKLYQQLLNYEIPVSEYREIYDDVSEIGWDKLFAKLNLSAEQMKKLDEVITIKLN